MKTKLCMFIVSLFTCLISQAQTMSVVEFKLDESDLTANTAGTIVYDQNAEKCALIKIETTEFGFSFDAGSLGVVKTEQHTGEIWLYIPEGVKRLSISHPQFEKIRDYDLGLSVKKARTYIMRLKTSKPSTTNADMGTLQVNTFPSEAEVIVDGITIGKSPLEFANLFPGSRKVTLKKEGFFDYDVEVGITANKTTNVEENLVKSCDILRHDDRIDITIKGISFSLIKVKGGEFQMGGTAEQKKAKTDEFPLHNVVLSDYYIGETEVTNELWSAIMQSNPTIDFSDPLQPVNNVSWYDCQRFMNRLSSLTGIRFTFPTEAQWEFAARGGNKSKHLVYAGSDKAKDVGWYKSNSKGVLKTVKSLEPNELGIYDMSGNVYEWCSDWYGLYKKGTIHDPKGPEAGTTKVNRSGGAGEIEHLTRVSCRSNDNPNRKHPAIGFRLAAIE